MGTSVGPLFRVWVPTAFGSSMLVVEIPVVYAAVSRSDGGARELAALGVCVALLVVVNTPALAVTPLVVVEQDRQPVRRLWRYALVVGAGGVLALAVLGVLPVAGVLTGGQAGLAGSVRYGLICLAPNSLGVAMRRYLHGRLIGAGRTGVLVPATIVRIAGSGALAWVGVAVLPGHGAAVGAGALSAGALLEAVLLAGAVRGLPAPQGRAGEPVPQVCPGDPTLKTRVGEPVRVLIGRHAHMSSARLLTMVPMLVTTVGIAHSAQAAPSLIVWPALYELAMLFASPVSDWESVSAMVLRADPADPGPRRLTLLLIVGFTGLFAAVLGSGLAGWYLTGLLAVPPGPARLGLVAAIVLLPAPAMWVLRTYLRGRLMARRSTRPLLLAAGVHLATLIAAVAGLSRTAWPGAVAACAAMLAGLLAELLVLGRAAAAQPARVPGAGGDRRRQRVGVRHVSGADSGDPQ